ncbi:MAG TPA: hypothetical protein VFH59_13360 [Frateuria sp.]|uniref:DUF3887 domain-containing protein n=1 Tax=Frateuria sp. TaxID=2211372 RepID=UPI002D7EF0DF|nr:hypothetical protein [Frateuria sp.]HET6806419.1 hypothetical protein [Frateuria sp.]
MFPSRLLVLAATAFAVLPAHAAAAADTCTARAAALFDALGHGDYEAASRQMDAKLRAQSFPQPLPAMWEALIKNNYGAYRGHGEGTATRNGDGTTTVSMPLEFERSSWTYRVTCDPRQGGIDEMLMQ